MWEYLSAPIDAERAHELSDTQLWHARMMFLAWGIIAPTAVIIARFFKVLPGQDWPNRLDSQFWWRYHWIGHSIVLVLTLVAAALVYLNSGSDHHWHGFLGYVVVALVCFQVILGYFRGTKGGPLDPLPDGSLRGDHYSMSGRRRRFELLHKSVGYATLLIALTTLFFGLWLSNSPRWMWFLVIAWWCLLVCVFIALQRRGMALDTYQAIWGPEPVHPGNKLPVSWGMNRRRIHTQSPAHEPTE